MDACYDDQQKLGAKRTMIPKAAPVEKHPKGPAMKKGGTLKLGGKKRA